MGFDPLAGTDLARAELPDTMTGFGIAELATIVAMHDGPASERSRQIFGIDPDYTSEDIVIAASSALVARGLLSARDDSLVALSSAALLEVATGQAVRWVRLGVIGGAEPAVIIVLQSPTVTALVEPNAMLTWWVAFQDADAPIAPVLKGLVDDRLAANPSAAVIVDMQSLDAARGNLLIRRTPLGAYDVIADADEEGEGGRPITIGEGGLEALFTEFVPSVAQS